MRQISRAARGWQMKVGIGVVRADKAEAGARYGCEDAEFACAGEEEERKKSGRLRAREMEDKGSAGSREEREGGAMVLWRDALWGRRIALRGSMRAPPPPPRSPWTGHASFQWAKTRRSRCTGLVSVQRPATGVSPAGPACAAVGLALGSCVSSLRLRSGFTAQVPAKPVSAFCPNLLRDRDELCWKSSLAPSAGSSSSSTTKHRAPFHPLRDAPAIEYPSLGLD